MPDSAARALLTLAVVLQVVACDGSRPTEPLGAPRSLAGSFRMTGLAEVTESDGTSVTCSLDLFFRLASDPAGVPHDATPGVLTYEGIFGGSVQRTILDAAGNGISLWPDVAGQVTAESIAPDRVQLAIPANEVESRFWRELASFEGRFDAEGAASGDWNCAPFDIDSGGYVDTRTTARGTWRLVPMH